MYDASIIHLSVFRRDINYFGINVCIIEPGFFKTAVTSLDPLERELHRLWDQLSPEVQASYGDKYLDKCKKTAFINVYHFSHSIKSTDVTFQTTYTVPFRDMMRALSWAPNSYDPGPSIDIASRT